LGRFAISADEKPVVSRRRFQLLWLSTEIQNGGCYHGQANRVRRKTLFPMVEWEAQIEQLKIKATNAKPEARVECFNAIAVLKQKRDEAALKLKGVSIVSDDEWEELKKVRKKPGMMSVQCCATLP